MIPTESSNVEDAIRAALVNIRQFQSVQFETWLSQQRASTQRLARRCPPNHIYLIADGPTREDAPLPALRELNERFGTLPKVPLGVVVDYRDMGPGHDIGLMVLGMGRDAKGGGYLDPLAVSASRLVNITTALASRFGALAEASRRPPR